MQSKENKLFRQEALERLSSPEQLDQMMQVVNRQSWLPLTTIGSLITVAIIWSVFGRIPFTVNGQGVLIRPGVVPLQLPNQGQILTLNLKRGDTIKKEQVLGTINQIELKQQLEQERSKLADVSNQDKETLEKSLKSIAEQREALQQDLQHSKNLIPEYNEQYKKLVPLRQKGAINDDMLLQARIKSEESQSKKSNLETKLKELDRQETQEKAEYAKNLTSMEHKIDQLELQLEKKSQIISPYDGHVLEVTISPGQTISAGSSIALIQTGDRNSQLKSVFYLPNKDGKKIKSGMPLQVTPGNVSRERFGGIVGKVTEVSPFPVTMPRIAKTIGNEDEAKRIVQSLSSSGGAGIEIFAQLEPEPKNYSRYKWSSSSGPSEKISSGTITEVRVQVEQRAPISYVIPILKSLTGIN